MALSKKLGAATVIGGTVTIAIGATTIIIGAITGRILTAAIMGIRITRVIIAVRA
jgi:hypothetical protein